MSLCEIWICSFSSVSFSSYVNPFPHPHISALKPWHICGLQPYQKIKGVNSNWTKPLWAHKSSYIERVGCNLIWASLCRQKGQLAIRTDSEEVFVDLGNLITDGSNSTYFSEGYFSLRKLTFFLCPQFIFSSLSLVETNHIVSIVNL